MRIQWNFYLSGILYGKIYEDQKMFTISLLNVNTGQWEREKTFSPEESLFLQKLCKRDLLEFFQEKTEYENNIRQALPGFFTTGGKEFTRRRNDSYYQRHQIYPSDLFYDKDGIYAVLMACRDMVGVLVKKGWEEKTVLKEWKKVYPFQNSECEEYQPGPVWPVSSPGNQIEKTPAVEYYTMGKNIWTSAGTWPPETSVPDTLYLGSGIASAKGSHENCGKGILTRSPAADSSSEAYIYDPENPAVHLVDMSENELEVPEDYTREEMREDILSFSTEALSSPITVTGDISVLLYVSCDCPDTDFFVRITDVDENGRSVKLADGVLGARYRNGFERPEYMEAGKIYPVRIRTTKLSNTFRKGHKIRLTITSGGENFIFPNSNTREGFDSLRVQKAHIQIHLGAENPSRIEFFREDS